MFIELADHLRCPADHDEQFLILLPERTEQRWVAAGDLGCPVCGRAFRIDDGIFIAGEPPVLASGPTALAGDALAALSGLGGPGGYMVVVGGASVNAAPLVESVPGVGMVAVNPDPPLPDGAGVSVIRAARLPLRSNSMRAAVLGPGYSDAADWIDEALRLTLPGLRVVGEGTTPERDDLEILATAAGCWVGRKLRNRYSA